jgi:cephalosporin hydroxylase
VDDRKEFEQSKHDYALAMGADEGLKSKAVEIFRASDEYNWSYQWNWLGVPIIQIPPDIVATQELIWDYRPQFIVETGIARGGSLIFYASILELIGDGRVIGIDIEIRDHNRESIESHPMSKRIDLIEGSSIDPALVSDVKAQVAGAERVMVILDSNHTHQHVLDELRLYAPMVTEGQYLIVADTVVEEIPAQEHRVRPWGPGNNPGTALEAFLQENDEFVRDPVVNAKLLVTSSRGGYLKRIKG